MNNQLRWICVVLLAGFVFLTIQVRENNESMTSKTAVAAELTSNLIYLPSVYKQYANLPPSLFGVQIYGSSNSSRSYHPYLIGSGASWLRTAVTWRSVEPVNVDPSAFNWSAVDSILAAAREDMGGLNIVATIEKAPEWVTPYEDGPIPAQHLDEFAEFVGALVERYDGDGFNDAPGSPVVTYWEFYNEPDNNFTQHPRRWGNNGAAYAQMLATVYPIVKAANPSAKVVIGGLAYDWFEENDGPFVKEFLSDVLDAGGGAYFDVMNFHSYPAFASKWTSGPGTGLPEKTAAIRQELANYGLSKPVIITEAGWHDNNNPGVPSTPEIQARYVTILFTQSMANDIDVMIWWMLYDPGGFYPYTNGLVTNDAQLPIQTKPSYKTYQLITEELGTAQFVRKLSHGETGNSSLEVYQFKDAITQQTLYVAWLNPVDAPDQAALKLVAPAVTVRDSVTGSSVQVLDGADGKHDGQVTLQIGGRPMFIQLDK